MKRYTTMQEYYQKARVGNILNAYLLNGEKVRDCFVWLESPTLQYAVVTEERSYNYPIILTTDLNSISVLIK